MLDKLRSLELRYEDLAARLNAPETYADPALVAKLNKEHSELEPLVETYRHYMRRRQDMEEARSLMSDPDMKELAQEEFAQAKAEAEELEQKIKILLLPADPNDGKNVIVEIRAGVGGEEAALFAGSLYRMYSMYAEARRWNVEVASLNETELGGIKEISFTVEGAGAYSRLKFESGVHRVQRVPETESGGRIHTSTVTVAVLPEAEEVDVDINPADIEMQVFRSSGAGGQHVNKTSSAVRLIHKPTGVVVSSQQERSQVQNRENCMKMLRAKLMEMKAQQHAEKISDIKGVQMKIEWGSQIRSYVFMPYTLAKDTRTGYENGNITAVMDGDIDGFINAYLTASATGELKK